MRRLRTDFWRAAALFALLVQLFLPLAVPMAMTVQSDGGAVIVICSADKPDTQPDHDGVVACKICDGAIVQPADLPATAAAFATAEPPPNRPVPQTLILPARFEAAPGEPRGPPLQV
jgi:hypothetical protein